MNIPDGFARVAPYIFATDADTYMDHLVAALDGEDTGRTKSADGTLANGRIRLGDATVMVSEAGREYAPSRAAFYLFVDDANAAIERAIENGMVKIMCVSDMPYGDRQGGARDIAGNIWGILLDFTAPHRDAVSLILRRSSAPSARYRGLHNGRVTSYHLRRRGRSRFASETAADERDARIVPIRPSRQTR